METEHLAGLVAATYTPMTPDGGLNIEQVSVLVTHLAQQQVLGLHVGQLGRLLAQVTCKGRHLSPHQATTRQIGQSAGW